MLNALIFICLLLFSVYYFLIRTNSRTKELISRFPGLKPLPIIGNNLDFNVKPTDLIQLFIDLRKQFSDRCAIWLGERPVLIIYNLKDIEVILSSSAHINKSPDYNFFDAWLGKGLLTSNGNKWRCRRKLLNPSFNYCLLEMFLDAFNNQSEILVEKLTEVIDKGSFDVFHFISLCTLDALCDTIMGQSVNAQYNSDSSYVKATNRMEYIFLKRQLNIFLWPDFIFNLSPLGRLQKKKLEIIHGFSEKVLNMKKEQYNNRTNSLTNNNTNNDPLLGKKHLTFIDILFQERDKDETLTDREIRDEVDTFMAAGNDSVAAGLSWTVFFLGSHLEIQEKAHKEIDQVFGNDKTRRITMDDLKNLKYLECIIKESHRILPPVPVILRELTEDITLDGKIVPYGTTIMIHIYLLHHDESIYPEPEVFNPDRFLSGNKPNSYSYLPFAAGPRNCIGQKYSIMLEKVILAYILRNFSFQSVHRMEDLKLIGQMTLRSEGGIIINMKKR